MKRSIKTRIISIATAALMTLSLATATMASASAATINGTQAVASQGQRINLSVNLSNEWKKDGAHFGAYFFNCVNGNNTWAKVDCRGYMGNYVSVEGDYTHVIFVRLKDTNLDWSSAWNKTADLRISDLNGSYTINGWELDANTQAAAPAAPSYNANQEIKLNVNLSDEWKTYSPRFAAYFFNCVNGNSTWANVECRGYMGNTVTVKGDYTHVIFVRLNNEGRENNFVKGNAWNKTPDLRISDLNGSYTINGWELDVE